MFSTRFSGLIITSLTIFLCLSLNCFAKFNGSVNNVISSNMYNSDSFNHSANNVTALILTNKFENELVVGAIGTYYKDLKGDREGKALDPTIYFSRSLYKFNDDTSLKGSVSLSIGMSDSSQNSYLRNKISLKPTISHKFGWLKLDNVSISTTPFFVIKNHKHKVDKDDKMNTSHIIGISTSINYSPTDKWSLGYNLVFNQPYEYGARADSSYSNTLSTYYAAHERIYVGVGISDGGNIYRKNFDETDVEVFDNEKATVFFDLTLSI